jgi:hypothetical protein
MSTKKKRNTKTDWQQVAQSMHDGPGTLYEKLKTIWDLAHRMIEFVYENHPAPIKKVLKRRKALSKPPHGGINFDYQEKDLKDFSIDINVNYVMLHRLDTDYEDSLIAESYFRILGTLARIQTKTNFVARYFHECRKSRVNTIEFIEKILSVDSQVPHSFMNDVVPLFFSLQLHCYNLVEIANRPPGIPADPRVSRNRSSIAGKSKNYGEHVLKGMISNFLDAQNPERKYRNVNSLFEKLEDGLGKTLNDYLDLLDSPTEAGGIPLRYGDNPRLTIDGISRKLHQWKNEDPEFRKHLERICTIR